MPKTKTTPSKRKTTSARKPAPKKTAKPSTRRAPAKQYSEEYTEYLERHTLYGEGRRRLSPTEFDRLDDELLDLLAQEMEHGLNDDQIIRVRELEYLLLDSEQ